MTIYRTYPIFTTRHGLGVPTVSFLGSRSNAVHPTPNPN